MIKRADAADDVKVDKLIEYRTTFQKCGCPNFNSPNPKYSDRDMRKCKHIEKIGREYPNLNKYHTQKLQGMDKYFCTCDEYFDMIKKGIPFKDVKCVHTYIEVILKRKKSMRNTKRALRSKGNLNGGSPESLTGDFNEFLNNFEIEPFDRTDGTFFEVLPERIDALTPTLAEKFTDSIFGYDEFYPETADGSASLISTDQWLRDYSNYFKLTLHHLDDLAEMGDVPEEDFYETVGEASGIAKEEATKFFQDRLMYQGLESIYYMSCGHGLCGNFLGDGLESTLRELYENGSLSVDWENVKDAIDWLLA